MTIEILRLSGTETPEAEQAASSLVDFRTGPRDLRNLLVVDDTALLVEHAPVYALLDNAGRVENMLCVAVGPRAGNGRALRLPGNLGGTQGSPVLWVGDPAGIDWRMAAATVAIGHPPGKISGLDHLVELLLVQDMFKRVYSTVTGKVPGRVASPGLWLAGAEDEAATFAAALALASHRLCDPGPGAEGPFPSLLPSQAGGVNLADGAPLARYRDEVAELSARAAGELGKLGGFGGLLRRGDGGARADIVEAGAALTDLRDLVTQLLRDANTTGELTSNQQRLLADAGIRFQPGPPASPSARADDQRPVYRTIAETIRGGDPLALVARRLTLTERELKRHGSASYLPEVGQRCPPPLLERLADPPQRLPRRTGAEVRHELGLDEATRAATALTDLVMTVASKEWSPAAATPGEVARTRVAIDGACKALLERTDAAGTAGGAGSGPRGAQLARLGESLLPVLRDLALRVLAAESARPSAGGQEAFTAARDRAAGLLGEWMQHVQANGVSSPPSFATSAVPETGPYADEDDVAEIREALLYRPMEEMWQLCAPGDLGVLNSAAVPAVVRFASRLNKEALAGTLPGEEPVWASSGSYAGQLRLVALRPGYVTSNWSETTAMTDPSAVTEPKLCPASSSSGITPARRWSARRG